MTGPGRSRFELGSRLLADLGLDGVTFSGPLNVVLGALAGGYAQVLADQVRAESGPP